MALWLHILMTTVSILPITSSFVYEFPKYIQKLLVNPPEDAILNFTQIASKYGYPCNEYKIVTEDKYILTLFHIPGDSSRPVFLMHGFLDSSDSFIIRANNSMSLTMARERNNDVWIGNMRDNRYSRHHVHLDPDKDKKFWDFSFHDVAYYDLPAMIDFILEKTGQTQLQVVGHSVGTAVFFVLGATRPEYNDKIKVFVALAPIAYLQNTGPLLSTLIKVAPIINSIFAKLGIEELLSNFGAIKKVLQILCSNKQLSNILCSKGILFQIDGPDPEEIEPEFVSIAFGHCPAGSSRKTEQHLNQVALRKKFAQYDYGRYKNSMIYNSTEPPEYDFSKVTMNIGLFVARNDKLSTLPDTALLRPKLLNVVEYHVQARKEANHYDFVWGKHMYRDLFPWVFKLLNKY